MMPPMTPLHHRLVAGLATLVVLASACSPSDSSTATSESTASAESTETPATEIPATEIPATEIPATDAPATDAPSTDAPTAETAADEAATTDVDRLGSYELADTEFGTMVTVTVDGATRTIVTNALPDHETGEFPNDGNPNTISAQDLTWTFPTEAVFNGSATFAMTPGVALNGIKFEPATAESVTCSGGENYRIEALQDTYDLGLDFNNAHVQPTGEYHYHGISELLVDAYSADDDLVLVGFAADGYLMYYSKSGAYEPGYEMSTTPRTGTDCVASGPNGTTFDLDGSAPDGTYTSDWTFSEEAGDLDSCNGIEIDGQYAYIVTDTYPFVGRCLNGDTSSAGGAAAGGAAGGGAGAGGAAGGGAGAGGAPPADAPDLAAAADALGITEDELRAALGGPPPDFAAAADTLGVTEDELTAALDIP